MKDFRRNIKRTFPLFAMALLIAVVIATQKILYLTHEPELDKDCPPVFPSGADDTDKPTKLVVQNFPSNLPWFQQGGFLNDSSCLDKTRVFGVVKIRNEDDIKNSLIFAGEKGLKVSMAGVKHSMGGQAIARQGLILDMTGYNQIVLNEEAKTITVHSGATWHQIQEKIHPKYAIKAMQSTDIFTVGGSISVNAHGMDHQAGALRKTIRTMRVMLPDGEIKKVSQNEDPELFNLVVGGYGLFGVILDVELEITGNDVYAYNHNIIDYKEFPRYFDEKILNNPSVGLFYGHLSTAPSGFLKEMILYSYTDTGGFEGEIRPLTEVSNVKMRRFFLNFAKTGNFGKELKWIAERDLEGLIESCLVNRNQALKDGESCFIPRNEPMHDSVPYLKNNLKNDTDILHEYFIPRSKFTEYIEGIRPILEKSGLAVLNASVRVVHKEENFLTYAPEDMFSVVLYINQPTTADGNVKMAKTTQELVDLTIKTGGRFFLPYQIHYSPEQLKKSYPQIGDFFTAKKKYDPEERLSNTFYETFSDKIRSD